MPLAIKLQSIEELSDELKALYIKDGDIYKLDLTEEVKTEEDITNLQSALRKEREAHKDLERKLKELEALKHEVGNKEVDKDEVNHKAVLLDRIKALESSLTEQENSLKAGKIASCFNTSNFILTELIIPADMIEARFGSQFSYQDGEVIARDTKGNIIYSKTNAEEPASFEEAIKYMIDSHPKKDSFYKGTTASGAGQRGGKTGVKGVDWKSLPPVERLQQARRK